MIPGIRRRVLPPENERYHVVPQYRVELLGGLRIQTGQQGITRLESRKAGALLACLALHPGRAFPRDTLAEWLWPDEDPEATRGRLRQALTALRRVLEPDGTPPGTFLIADRSLVRLASGVLTTDVAEFEGSLREAGRQADPAARARGLRRAVEIYHGELLDGYDEPWAEAERGRLGEAYLGALGRLAEAQQEAGELDSAIETARRLIALDPVREQSHCRLMRLYAAAGRASEALRQYRELERVLCQELDARPSAAARELIERLQAGAEISEAKATENPPLPPDRLVPEAAAAPRPDASPHAPSSAPLASGAKRPSGPRLFPYSAAAILIAAIFLLGSRLPGVLSLVQEKRTAAARILPASVDAETFYRHGRDAWNRRSKTGFEEALRHFERAAALNPRHAGAYSGIADTHSLLAYYGFAEPQEARRKATAAAQQALTLAPASPETHASLGWIKMAFDWEWEDAEREFVFATSHTTPYATAHQWYSLYHMVQERTSPSLDAIRRARDLEPRSVVIAKSEGQRYYHARKYGLAIRKFREVLETDPTSSLTYYWLGLAMEQQAVQERRHGEGDQGRAELRAALEAFQKASRYSAEGSDPMITAAVGHLHAVSGQTVRAREILAQLEAPRAAASRYVSPVALAAVYVGLGDHKRALDCLERAEKIRSPELILLKIEPRFDSLHEETRFVGLIGRIWKTDPAVAPKPSRS